MKKIQGFFKLRPKPTKLKLKGIYISILFFCLFIPPQSLTEQYNILQMGLDGAVRGLAPPLQKLVRQLKCVYTEDDVTLLQEATTADMVKLYSAMSKGEPGDDLFLNLKKNLLRRRGDEGYEDTQLVMPEPKPKKKKRRAPPPPEEEVEEVEEVEEEPKPSKKEKKAARKAKEAEEAEKATPEDSPNEEEQKETENAEEQKEAEEETTRQTSETVQIEDNGAEIEPMQMENPGEKLTETEAVDSASTGPAPQVANVLKQGHDERTQDDASEQDQEESFEDPLLGEVHHSEGKAKPANKSFSATAPNLMKTPTIFSTIMGGVKNASFAHSVSSAKSRESPAHPSSAAPVLLQSKSISQKKSNSQNDEGMQEMEDGVNDVSFENTDEFSTTRGRAKAVIDPSTTQEEVAPAATVRVIKSAQPMQSLPEDSSPQRNSPEEDADGAFALTSFGGDDGIGGEAPSAVNTSFSAISKLPQSASERGLGAVPDFARAEGEPTQSNAAQHPTDVRAHDEVAERQDALHAEYTEELPPLDFSVLRADLQKITAKVTRHQQREGNVVKYEILVAPRRAAEDGEEEEGSRFWRRYASFDALKKEYAALLGEDVVLPKFPKKSISKPPTQEQLDDREQGLHAYLLALHEIVNERAGAEGAEATLGADFLAPLCEFLCL